MTRHAVRHLNLRLALRGRNASGVIAQGHLRAIIRRAGFFRRSIRLFGVPQRPAWGSEIVSQPAHAVPVSFSYASHIAGAFLERRRRATAERAGACPTSRSPDNSAQIAYRSSADRGRAVLIRGPETAAVGRQHFIDENERAIASWPNSNLVSAMITPRAPAWAAALE